MSKKNKGRTVSSLNTGFSLPDTYIIIFLVVCLAALLTYIIPQGIYETEDVTYVIDGVETSKTVIKDGSFQYVLDEDGRPLKDGIALFAPGGETGLFNYLFEGLVSGDKWGAAVGIVAFILVIGGSFGIVLRTGAVEAGIMNIIKKTHSSRQN